jgi:hypothetical protein
MASTIAAGTTSGTAIAIAGDTSGVLQLQTNGTTAAVTIDTSQKVGIGTASPTGKLHVYGSGEVQTLQRSSGSANNYTLFKTEAGADQAYLGFSDASVNDFAIYNVQNGYVRIATNNTERMRILSDGSILLGTTTAEGATGISFSNASDSAAYGKSMYMNSPYNGTRNAISFAYNSVGVGQIVTSTNSVAYNSGSDYRLKENIAPMTGALAKVAQLKPVTYKWKSDGSDGQGFIAHELAEVVPDCVTGEKDAVETYTDGDGNEQTRIKPQGVDTSFLVATLTAAIQELNAKVEAQAVRIAELEGAK